MSNTLAKRFKGSVKSISQVTPPKKRRTGIIGLDYVLTGGVPQGCSIEFFGAESTGKTTVALECCRNPLKDGLKVLFIDAENSFNKEHSLELLGLPLTDDNFQVATPTSGEEGIDMMVSAMREDGYALIIVDSVSEMRSESSQEKVEKDSTAQSIGNEASMWKSNGPRISRALTNSPVEKTDGTVLEEERPSCIFINQERPNIGNPYGGKTTPGGTWLRYHYSMRIRLNMTSKQVNDNTGARPIHYEVAKNKVGPPNRSTDVAVLPEGIDKIDDLINFSIYTEKIKRKGSWYSFSPECAKALGCKEQIGQGMTPVYKLLQENEEVNQALYDQVLNEVL
jgi:recombination protein RecA